MMIPTRIHIPADTTVLGLAHGAHRLVADETLRRRTGRDFGATVADLGEAEACNLVVSQHSDIAGALGCVPCACAMCGKAGTVPFAAKLWSAHHIERHPVHVVGVGLAFEVKLGHITLRLEDPNGETLDHWKCRRTPSYA